MDERPLCAAGCGRFGGGIGFSHARSRRRRRLLSLRARWVDRWDGVVGQGWHGAHTNTPNSSLCVERHARLSN